MSKPTTRQDSKTNTSRTLRTSPKRKVVNPNLIDLSVTGRGKVLVTTRAPGRGRGTTPHKEAPGSSRTTRSQSSSSTRAVRASPVSSELSRIAVTEEHAESLKSELLSETQSIADPEPFEVSASSAIDIGLDRANIPEEMATGGQGREGGNQSTDGNAMADLLAYFQEAMRNTQEEFRRELATLRESIGTANNNRPDSAPAVNIHPSGSQANSYSTFHSSVKLKDWKVSYSGEGSIADFLFKLDTLVERTQCPHDHLMSNFHIFLTGKAETFYWDYIRQHPRATFPMLKTALSMEFGSRESDHEILLKISTRKQLAKESYDDFHSFIVRWNLRLTNPMSDAALVEIIKKNVHADLKVMLFTASPTDLGNLRDLARKAEKILQENKNSGLNRQRQVNEITAEPTPEDAEAELDPQVEALKINRTWVAGDYSKIKCWNCLELGHSYIYCPDEKRNVFCYKCGQKGVTTVNCKGPHKGNQRRSEWATGDARSSK